MGAAKLVVITAFALLTGILCFCNGVCVISCCDSVLLFPILIIIQHVLRGRKINGTAHFNSLYPNDAKSIKKSDKCISTDDFEDFLFNVKAVELKDLAASMDEHFSPNTNTSMPNMQCNNPFPIGLEEPNMAYFDVNSTDNECSTVDLHFNVNNPLLVDILRAKI
ncbi:hypothetical protein CDAR_95481 [Caerostris darwini]|uniref:Uncharacterized protein n=1 Tax=Caerostris darwini TaxID=1538125 RepID=A0AAV4PID9_9ARAC|nr:hypothetical protein CDAR_95481 [Caerostris darwini]